MWPEHRATWEEMSPAQRVAHVGGVMDRNIAGNATGPKWDFGVVVDDVLVGHVDCDLASPNAPLHKVGGDMIGIVDGEPFDAVA